MSRTYRNRHTVPHGYEVRDGGRLCRSGASCTARDEVADGRLLSRPRPYRRFYRCCESAPARREHSAWYRRVCHHLLREGRDEDILPFRGTSGWKTW